MKKILNVGIVGFGYMGKMHSMCYENIKYYYDTDITVCLYAVVSAKAPEQMPVSFKKYYKDVDALLADDNVDIVDICSPNYLHKDILLKAIKAQKHIYCEKPLTVDLLSAKEVINQIHISQYNKISRIAFEYRFIPAVMRAKQIIEDGLLGNIINFNFKYYGCEFLDPKRCISWQSTKKMSGGGVLYALGTHSIDLIRYLIGDVTEVFAQEKTYFKQRPLKEDPSVVKDVDIEDIINAQLTCDNNAMGTLLLSQVAAGSGVDFSFEIYGEKGAVKFNHENANVIYYYNNKDEKEPTGGFDGFKAIETTQKYGGAAVFPPPRVTIAWSRYHIASIYDFLNAVAGENKTYPDIEDGYKVQQITDAIYRSAASGKIEKIN